MKKIFYLLLLSTQFEYLFCKHYLIDTLQIQGNRLLITPATRFQQRYLREPVFQATYENGVNLQALDETTLSTPFILSVISIIWASGETYYVHRADAQLMKSLSIIKKVYKVFYPEVKWDGKLLADSLVEHTPTLPNETVAQLFSGGLDSIYTSFVFRKKPQLLITIQGFSDEAKSSRWAEVKNQVVNFAQTYGNRTNFFVKSNFRTFIRSEVLHNQFPRMKPWQEFCQESLSLAGISIPIMAAHNCKSLLIPSSYDWNFPYAWGSHPFIDNNIGFKNIRVENHTYSATRQDKIRYIAEHTKKELPKPVLYTCRNGKNASSCSRCEKCIQTICGLLIEGENPKNYGYSSNSREGMVLTKKMFRQRKPFSGFSESKLYKWKTIQRRASQLLKKEKLPFIYKLYFRWLMKLDFNNYYKSKKYRHVVDFQKHMNFLDPKFTAL